MSGDTDLDGRPSAADARVSESVPVIDIGDLAGGVGESGCRSIGEIAAACREWGFFQIVNHGIPGALIDEAWTQSRRFFASAAGTKEAILRTRENPWGYYNNELTKNRRDKKEVFDFTSAGVDAVYRAENRWPDLGGQFRTVMEAYRDACAALSLKLLQAMIHGLGVRADSLDRYFDPGHTGFVRLNYYPVKDPLQGRADIAYLDTADLGVHHHTDAGALTVLLQDEVGGLQVFKDGCWHHVAPLENAFVINTGDMMQVWSNDTYQAAIHRVLAMESVDRYSIPFFYNPDAGTRIDPLPPVVGDAAPARYRTINWSEFRSQRTDGDYADYGSEVQISQYRI